MAAGKIEKKSSIKDWKLYGNWVYKKENEWVQRYQHGQKKIW